MNDEDHDGHTINLGPPAGSPADERPKWDPREEDDWYPPHAPPTPVDEAERPRTPSRTLWQVRHNNGLEQGRPYQTEADARADAALLDEHSPDSAPHWVHPVLIWDSPPVSPPVPECDVSNGPLGTYRCTLPTGHEGDHAQQAVIASWSVAAADREDRADG